jgi:nitrate reductase beta subunit
VADVDDEIGMTAFDAVADKFHLTDTNGAAPAEKSARVNLLNWDGASTNGLFPVREPNGDAIVEPLVEPLVEQSP